MGRSARFAGSWSLARLALWVPLGVPTGAAACAQVTTPEAHLGRPVAADFQLADWDEVSSYFRRLDRESDAVTVEGIGTTTEGREFLLATISSARNLASLDAIRAAAARIADPRGLSDAEKDAAIRDGRPTLFISCAMHSTETAAPQFAMEFAWRLATSDEEPWRSAREDLVVLIAPCTNPDGLDEVVRWYRETVGTPHEATGLTRLYQRYAGHDNNRDWFMLTQAETRIVTRQLYSVWRPHVYWDVHQQGSNRERMFVPPFRDPLNPNLDPAVMAGIDLLGTRALLDMTRAGLTGVSTGVSYDMWWNGGNRNVPVRHNILGLLTEAASVKIASPIFLAPDELRGPAGLGAYAPSNRFPAPWPGGWWRLRDIVDYEMAFGRSLLASLSAEPEAWLRSAMDAAQRALERGRDGSPRAWIVPSDNEDVGACRRLADVLLQCGVELHAADGPVRADGREWPAGSIVILREQPYGAHVKDLFEVQRYPDGEPPYDVAGWTLPFLLGVHRVECATAPEGTWTRATSPQAALAGFASGGGPRDSDTWRRTFQELKGGAKVAVGDREIGSLPRIGVHSPWSGSMSEGWTRWVLDEFGVPYQSVRNETLRAGRLGEFLDVLVLPGVPAGALDAGRAPGTVRDEFAGGLAPEGASAIEEFVRGGGTLVACGRSGEWAVELLELRLKDVARAADAGRRESAPDDEPRGASSGFSCPGSVLRAIPDASAEATPWTSGLPLSLAVFFSGSSAWRSLTAEEIKADPRFAGEDPRVPQALLRYAPTRLLLSGWIREPGVIEGSAAWMRVPHGAGALHLFGFEPQYRGWSQASFQLLFRAMLLR